jgi:hypothetical protein
MNQHTQHHLAHAAHLAMHTETGKKLVNTALAAGTAAAGLAVGTAAAPVVVSAALVGGLGYLLWRVFKD